MAVPRSSAYRSGRPPPRRANGLTGSDGSGPPARRVLDPPTRPITPLQGCRARRCRDQRPTGAGGPGQGLGSRRLLRAATDRARDTDQVDVAALHKSDRAVTAGLHDRGASPTVRAPVNHPSRSLGRPQRDGPGSDSVRSGTAPVRPPSAPGTSSVRTPARPPKTAPACELRHTPGRPRPPYERPLSSARSVADPVDPFSHQGCGARARSRVRRWISSCDRTTCALPHIRQFGPVVDLAYTRERATW